MLSNITFLVIFVVKPKFRKDRLNRCRYIAIFVIFNMATAAILDFQKFQICGDRGQCASLCQISSKSVKRFKRYGDLTF